MSGISGGRSDEQLLAAAETDAEAFGEFYDRHIGTIVAWFTRRTACPEAAADLAAETFADAFRLVHRYRPSRGEPRAWLFGIANNKWRHYARTGDISTRALRRLGVSADTLDHADTVAQLVDLDSFAVDVDAILGRLSGPIAEAVRLRVVEQLSYAEVAGRLGCSEGAARVRVTRGLARLQDDTGLEGRYRATFTIRWAT